MKKALFFSIIGFGVILSTAYLTYQNMQLYMQQRRLPSSVSETYNEDQIEYLRDLKNLNSEYRKELEVCESEFDSEFDWYLNMEVKIRRKFLKQDANLFGILKKLDNHDFMIPSLEIVLKKLTNPISKTFKKGEVIDAIGYYSSCKLKEKGLLIGDLLDVSHQKKYVALSLLKVFKKHLITLQYPSYSMDILGFLGAMENLVGRNQIDFYRIQDLMKDYHNYHKNLIKKYEKSGFDFDRGGPKFNHEAQVESYEFAKKLQPQIISLISQIQKNI